MSRHRHPPATSETSRRGADLAQASVQGVEASVLKLSDARLRTIEYPSDFAVREVEEEPEHEHLALRLRETIEGLYDCGVTKPT
jgi:hypothetical protein